MKSAKITDTVGTLYLVATPIGNMEDMTFRAVRILKEAQAVYCEDTRRTLLLLKHFEIERPNGIDSFHDHSPRSVLSKIKGQLESGKNVAYVTDGGMPVVSDPGFVLVRAAMECGASVTVVPGPSAAGMVFAASALASPKYFFHGFFPRTHGEVERTLEVVRANPVVHIFYEAPGRIVGSLEILKRQMPKSQVVVGRELTKLHEEFLRDTSEKVYEELACREKVKGECVIAILGGIPEEKRKPAPRSQALEPGFLLQIEEQPQLPELTDEQKAEVAILMKSGISSKDAAKELSKKFGVSRRTIYEYIVRKLT